MDEFLKTSALSELDKLLLNMRSVEGIGNISLWKIISKIGNYIPYGICKYPEICLVIKDIISDMSGAKWDQVRQLVYSFGNGLKCESSDLIDEVLSDWEDKLWFGRRYGCEYLDDLFKMRSPPVFVYGAGKYRRDGFKIGVVGTRKMTRYGRDIIREFISILAHYDCTIFTGFADGVDWTTFEYAIKDKINVCGVIPWSLSKIPGDKKEVIMQSIKNGKCCIINEYNGSDKLSKGSFLLRNEMLSALVDILVVVEAPQQSGTLHTVGCAIEMNKKVAVFPGDIFSSSSQGSNKLLADNRVSVLYSFVEVDNILRELCNLSKVEFKYTTSPKEQKFDTKSQNIIDSIKHGAQTLGDITIMTGFEINSVCKILTKLEIEGIVKTNKLGYIQLL